MDKKSFHKKLKHMLSQTKRGKYDSPVKDMVDMFHNEVVGKSGGGWKDEFALDVMNQIELLLDVQPEATRVAESVKEEDIKRSLSSFLTKRGYEYTAIEEEATKTPDGHIEGFGYRYICEIKSPILRFDNKARPFGYKFSTTHRTILDFIHTAIKQFNEYDKDGDNPHILIYTSAHSQLNWSNFIDAIRGGVVDRSGKMTTDLRNTHIYKSTKDLVYEIDLYVWLQMSSSKFFQASYFINNKSKYRKEVEDLVNNLCKDRLSEMDNLIVLD